MNRAGFVGFVGFLGFTLACGGGSPLARFAPKRSAHETYAESLREAGLDDAALGKAWLDAAAAALVSPPAVTLPLRETGYLDPATPSAVAYRFELPRGRRLAVNVTLESRQPARLFLDLFRAVEGGTEHLASADAGATELQHVARSAGTYILRLQAELLGGGRYTITQRTESTLGFPVKDAGEADIGSLFGDARDGGSRDHHGVDIFAPRGTPVLAAADGIVGSVATTDIGGRVVWLYDATQGQSLYYAHLDDWAVRDGQRVAAGDVLGFVGNTGNARTTPPHLHFGIYSRGPVDPLPFIRASDRVPAAPAGRLALLGEWGRIARGPAVFRAAPDTTETSVATLPNSTAVRVHAATASFFRVSLPDGRQGFIEAGDVGGAGRPLRTARLARAAPIRDHPAAHGIIIRHLDRGTRVPVLAEFSDFLLVEAPEGGHGWLQRDVS